MFLVLLERTQQQDCTGLVLGSGELIYQLLLTRHCLNLIYKKIKQLIQQSMKGHFYLGNPDSTVKVCVMLFHLYSLFPYSRKA